MSVIPDLIDNRQVHLQGVLKDLLRGARQCLLSIVTAYFNLPAFRQVAPEIDSVSSLRLLVGKEQEQSFILDNRLHLELEEASATGESEWLEDLKKWQAFLQGDEVQVRLYKKGFLHGKAYIIEGIPTLGQVGIVGSSNFTGAGLTTNLELNAVLKQDFAVQALKEWFEALWVESEDYKARLLELLTIFTQEYTPYEVYIKILYEAFSDRLDQPTLKGERGQPSPIVLADFQHDGYLTAREILEHYGGVILADSVGLGKTWLALRLLDDYAYHQRQTALIICPAQLRDTLWSPLLKAKGIPHEIISMEQVSQKDFPIEEYTRYKVIVVDESHNFRNDHTNRWQNLFQLAQTGDFDERKLILLTATPVNNTVYDLYNQLRFITRDRRDFFAEIGIRDLFQHFRQAEQKQEALYEIAEAVMVRRSRQFIRQNYPNAMVDGQPVHFPERRLHTVHYSLGKSYAGLYEEVATAIENLILAPYQLDLYRHSLLEWRRKQMPLPGLFEESPLVEHLTRLGWTKEEARSFAMTIGRQTALAHIMRVLYLKRLESSVHALRISLRRQRDFQKAFLEALERGRLLNSAAYRKWLQTETGDDLTEEELDLGAVLEELPPLPKEEYDLEAIRKAVQVDIQVLDRLLEKLQAVTPQQDDKLRVLKRLLTGELKGHKVVAFSYFKDTARYLYNQLRHNEGFLQALGHRRLSITDSEIDPEERRDRIMRFAPRAHKQPHIKGTEREIDLLISTDVLSEGQNLQDADVVINYDLHWNPIRMVQRAGRIDRVDSPYDTVYIYNFIPEDALENLLGLMKKLREKLDAINRTVGLDASVLGESPNPMDFNTLRRIAREEREVVDELEAESEFTVGEFLMQDLLDYMSKAAEERLKRMPIGIALGSVKDGKGTKGFFAAFRVRKTDRHYWFFAREDGKIVERRLEAIRFIRSKPDEPRASVEVEPGPHVQKLRRYLWQRLQQVAHRLPVLPNPQNHIVNLLHTMNPSALRNELLAYFEHPLPGIALRELRKLWRQIRSLPPLEQMKQLKEFADAHPLFPERPQEELRDLTEEDIELIGWMALV